MEENPYKSPGNFDKPFHWPFTKWKWYEWAVIASVVAILIALLQPATQSGSHRRRQQSANEPTHAGIR